MLVPTGTCQQLSAEALVQLALALLALPAMQPGSNWRALEHAPAGAAECYKAEATLAHKVLLTHKGARKASTTCVRMLCAW